ncbi:MAG TPA: hypothetical protein VLJ17_06605 [Xanthobacteraceae bacterium]|nr:hypothetical protein [Xanthobacteraceae bacterium]
MNGNQYQRHAGGLVVHWRIAGAELADSLRAARRRRPAVRGWRQDAERSTKQLAILLHLGPGQGVEIGDDLARATECGDPVLQRLLSAPAP